MLVTKNGSFNLGRTLESAPATKRGSVRYLEPRWLGHCIGIAQAMTPITRPPNTTNGAGTLSTSEKPKHAIPMQMDVVRNGEEMYALVPSRKTLEMMRPTAAWQRVGDGE